MPLIKSKSKKAKKKNFKKLMDEKPGKSRAKAIRTIAKRRGVSLKKAQQIQAGAIVNNMR